MDNGQGKVLINPIIELLFMYIDRRLAMLVMIMITLVGQFASSSVFNLWVYFIKFISFNFSAFVLQRPLNYTTPGQKSGKG